MAYEAAIFDLDGTLLDTLDDLHASVNFALASEGLPARSRSDVRAFLGNGVARLVHLSVPEGTPEEQEARALATFREHYARHNAERTAPYPQVKELLRVLSGEGVLRAVVSNKPDPAVQDLVATYFGGLFDAVVGERPDVRRKPAPDSLLAVTSQLGCRPERVVYVGDSEVDLQTARNAGVDCIAVSWGFRDVGWLRAQGATTIVGTTEELAEAILF
ncbi:hypothetical protein HMPREF1008_00154 [Olsenella sp. oral taxon 809 str. F0356]|uniref:HAD family hydrolase n=1 Tax=Olsenella sp. oral taxon 809 TaxID=661086 RepID=UPI000231F0BE|nr:HAD-IA family hydrolase [Olsenella sp. oral taxon 809]EHF02509.1 hypothetical protein HMPREF1008_00154 [Olsenella sp. oral taxon 809 str. F0356]